ncbi:hypothetical protein GWN26_03000 [Candidatus Saccharibacteria bacterium]|nr:hypothetical protein [Candidatus Saccharibacteria bacterium]
MEALCRRSLAEGKNLGRGILKIDSFLNYQLGVGLMVEVRVVKKSFEGGREALAYWGVPIEAADIIIDMRDGKIILE